MGDSLDATSDELYQHSPIALSLALPYIAHYDLTVLCCLVCLSADGLQLAGLSCPRDSHTLGAVSLFAVRIRPATRHSRRPWLHCHVIKYLPISVAARAASTTTTVALLTTASAVFAQPDYFHRAGNTTVLRLAICTGCESHGQKSRSRLHVPCSALSLFCSAALPSGHDALMPRCPGNMAVCVICEVCSQRPYRVVSAHMCP
jgi:hypothetical protein